MGFLKKIFGGGKPKLEAAKIDRLESMQQLRELPHRYAMAVDARDIDSYLNCFIPDVDCGRRGKGREAFRPFVEAAVRNF